jgi:hypothetical protein
MPIPIDGTNSFYPRLPKNNPVLNLLKFVT